MKSLHVQIPLLLCLLFAGCSKQSAMKAAPADVVARVGDQWIRQSDLDFAMESAGARSPAQVLQNLIDEETLAQQALAEGLVEDASVRAAVRRLLGSRYLDKASSVQPIVEDRVLREAWESAGDRFTVPAAARIAVLRRRAEGDVAEAMRALEAARQAYLTLPEDPRRQGFGPLAVSVSDDNDTRFQGGDCGWVVEGRGMCFCLRKSSRLELGWD